MLCAGRQLRAHERGIAARRVPAPRRLALAPQPPQVPHRELPPSPTTYHTPPQLRAHERGVAARRATTSLRT